MKKVMSPRMMLITSMVIFGTLGPFVRNIPVTSGELALYRAVLAAALVGIFLLITGQRLSVGSVKKEIFLLLLSGGAMGFNWILLFEAYCYTSVAVATLCYYMAPVIIILVSPLLFNERINGKKLCCILAALIGIVLVSGVLNPTEEGNGDYRGVLLGLAAAVLYATVMLLNKFIKGVTGLQRTFIQFLAAIIVLLPYVAFGSGFRFSELDGRGFRMLLIVGLVHTGITYCLYFSSLKELPGQETAILSYIDPLVAVICSVFVLGEAISLPQILGGVLILGFTLWSELPVRKRK